MSDISVCSDHRKDSPHHPHYGFPGCDDWMYGHECCEEILVCWVCGQPWPCDTKMAHVAARKALSSSAAAIDGEATP